MMDVGCGDEVGVGDVSQRLCQDLLCICQSYTCDAKHTSVNFIRDVKVGQDFV